MIIKNRDIIIVGLQPWHNEIGSNCRNIAMEFAKHNRVLYVNHPLDRISVLRKKANANAARHVELIKNQKENLMQVGKNMWNLYPLKVIESANWIPSTPLFRAINRINNIRFAREIQQAAQQLGFSNYILFNDSDMFRSFHLKELLRPEITVYYTRDNLMGVPYWYKHGHEMEPELFAKSDVVVANSLYLARVAAQHNKHSYYVGQGCEVDAFDASRQFSTPEDLASVKRPIIGYIGALYQLRLHLNLLEQLASTKKEWNFVFIGPEDEAFRNSPLHGMENVHFLGLKDVSELPAYLAGFDVAINPQVVNEVTIGNYPRKIDEYLAMGKPVVATPTEAMEIFAGYVYFAATPEAYSDQIEKALLENTEEKRQERIAFARSHTWENSVREIYEAIGNVIKTRERGNQPVLENSFEA